MSEFSVNTGKIKSIADMLEQQAKELENAENSIDSIRSNLKIQNSSRAQVMSAMKTTSNTVREEASVAVRMGMALREIAESYRAAENNILGRISSNGGYAGNGGSNATGEHGTGTQNGDNTNSSIFSSDPVNLNTGNFILENVDIEVPGFQEFKFSRYYNSRGGLTGILGCDWNTGFEMKLFFTPNYQLNGSSVAVMWEDGRMEYFAVSGEHKFFPVSGTTSELSNTENGYAYQTLEGQRYLFGNSGRFERYEDLHCVGYNLVYDNDVLKKVEKDTGEFFAFTYDNHGFLSTVEDHTGRVCKYIFEGSKLKKVILPDNNCYQYDYDENGKISRVLNPRKIGAVETVYDELFRVVYQRFADGTTNKFEYKDAEQAVVMIERNGSRSVHYHNDEYQNVRNVYLDGEERFEYNERGLKKVIVDKLGNITHLQYDNRGNVVHVLDANKNKISATYNNQNRLLTLSVNGRNKVSNHYNKYGDLILTEDGIGRKTSFTYDELGHPIKIELPDKTEIYIEYDKRGNATTVTNIDGGITRFVYDELNQLCSKTNALGRKSDFKYDVMGRIISEIRPDGNSRNYQYDEWGNIVSIQNYDGSVMTYAYNENNKPITITNAAGKSIYFEYDSMWNVTRAVLPNEGILRYIYDENNHMEMACDAEGNETHFTYDAMGNILSRTLADGSVIHYEWDADGRCIKIIDADGSVRECKYDEEDNVIYFKDAQGSELFRTFDTAGQLIAEEDSFGRTRRYDYDQMGNMVSLIDEKGHETKYKYAKGVNKVEEIIFSDGTKEQYSYDLNGNIRTYTNKYGITMYYEYDELDRVIKVYEESGIISEYAYDLMNRMTEKKDFNGNITRYQYTITGQLEKVTDALGNETLYSYDAMDEIIGAIRKIPGSKNDVSIKYERNYMEQVTKFTDPLGYVESYSYNCLGKMSEKRDRDNYLSRYFYNELGLLQSVKWEDGKEVEYQYDNLRRLNRIHDWTGDTEIKYDSWGRPLQVVYPDNKVMKYGYDSHGNRTEMTYSDGKVVSYEYDTLDRLSKISRNDDFTVYKYNKNGDISARIMSNGSDIQYQYNEHGLLSRMLHRDSKGILDDFSFDYDLGGRKVRHGLYRRDFSQDNGNYEYKYDAVGHLSQVQKDHQVIHEYFYDALGNRSGMSCYNAVLNQFEKTKYEYDIRGSLLKLEGVDVTEEYEYDQRGNLVGLIKNGQVSHRYTYGALNRITEAKSLDGEAYYSYNGLGYRVGMQTKQKERVDNISYTVDYSRIYDNLLEKTTNSESEIYIWGNGLESYISEAGQYGWYVTDPIGSVLRRMDNCGTQYVGNYNEFGCNPSMEQNAGETFGYSGFQFDVIAGTYFAQARQYRTNTGLFDAMDRYGGDIRMPDTINPYLYCAQDPLNRTDKSAYYFGFDDAVAAVIGAVGGIVGQLAGDVINGIVTGNFQFSSIQQYIGAAIGGAAGAVTTMYAGPIVGGAVSGAVSTGITELLTWASDPSGYNKSFQDATFQVAKDAGMGALSGLLSKIAGKIIQGIAGSSWVQNIVSKLKTGGNISNMFADIISNKALGKSDKWWSVMSDYLRNQHNAIGQSDALRRRLLQVLMHALPVYLLQEIWSKIKPSKLLEKYIKALFKNRFTCAACAGGGGGGNGGGGGR